MTWDQAVEAMRGGAEVARAAWPGRPVFHRLILRGEELHLTTRAHAPAVPAQVTPADRAADDWQVVLSPELVRPIVDKIVRASARDFLIAQFPTVPVDQIDRALEATERQTTP